jgi:hypothetical protein
MVDSSEMKNTKEQVFGERGGKTRSNEAHKDSNAGAIMPTREVNEHQMKEGPRAR